MRVHSLTIILSIILLVATGASGSVPNFINFQGTLTDTAGNPITGTRSMQFSLYDDTLSSSQLWDEFYPSVNIRDGLFRVQLGAVDPIPPSLFDGRVLWLGILAEFDPQEMTPRFPIVTTPYSFRSNNADVALTASLASYAFESDSANYADESGVATIAGYALTSDTSEFAYSAGISDDAIHSVYSDTANIAMLAGWANDGLHSMYSDTANYAQVAVTDSDWVTSGSDVYHIYGNVGVGWANPNHKLDVNGDVNITTDYKILGTTALSVEGTQCLLVGRFAGENNSGIGATLVGDSAGFNNAAWENTFVGNSSGLFTSNGAVNTFVGSFSGYTTTSGSFNTFIGRGAGAFSGGGGYNTYLGTEAGFNNTGSWNTFLGGSSGHSATYASGNVFLGYRSGYYETGSNKLYIANGSDDDDVLIYGDFSTGNVGIGTTNPDVALQIGDGTHSPIFVDTGLQLDFDDVGQHGVEIRNNNGAAIWSLTSTADVGIGSLTYGKNLNLMAGNYVRETIQGSTGNVGIGTQNPTRLLHLYGDSNPRLLIEAPSTQVPELNLQRGSTTYALYVNSGNDLVFYKSGDRMKLTDGGDVGIGINTPGYRLDVGGDIQCVALHETSDQRFKTNVHTLDNALEKVSQLRGVEFEWNQEAESVGATPGDHQIGLVAQEVERVIPELVSTPENGYKSVDYTKLTAVLIEAVKEMDKKIAALQEKNQALTERIQDIETMGR